VNGNYAVGIVGAFAFDRNIIGGQTVKTRLMLEYLQAQLGEANVHFTDTSIWRDSPITLMKSVKKTLHDSNCVIIGLNKKGMQTLFPLILFFNRRKHRKLVYLVIGGWLPDYLESHPFLKRKCRVFSKIFVETTEMMKELKFEGFQNVVRLPNFKNYEFVPRYKKSSKTFKTVFFSRVCREKGVELAIEAVSALSENYSVQLDIYGPIQPDYREHFESLVNSSSSVNYMGILKPDSDETYEVLSNYDLMLFPTFHVGEGFPGALIDAYISGLPVIASDWKYNSEIIVEGVTGWLVSPKDVHSLEVAIENAIKNVDRLAEMRLNCVQEAKKYHVDNVLPKLLKEIGITIKTN